MLFQGRFVKPVKSCSCICHTLTDQLGAPRKVLDPSGGAVIWLWDSKEAYDYQSPNEDPGSTGSVFHLNASRPGT
jgi:hypothetical protein